MIKQMNLNVILKKEAIDPEKITDEHVIVIFDILLATSTIVSMLQHGAKEVYPVTNQLEALSLREGLVNKSPLVIGEENGQLIDGFLAPNPLSLREKVNDRAVILLTTNGTVAIQTVAHAQAVYVASLLNGKAIAQKVIAHFPFDKTVHLVCSGSSNQFCMEDFYGVGFVIDEIVKELGEVGCTLTDSAKAAHLFYQSYRSKEQGEQILRSSAVGHMLTEQGLDEDLVYVNKRNIYSIVPQLQGDRIMT